MNTFVTVRSNKILYRFVWDDIWLPIVWGWGIMRKNRPQLIRPGLHSLLKLRRLSLNDGYIASDLGFWSTHWLYWRWFSKVRRKLEPSRDSPLLLSKAFGWNCIWRRWYAVLIFSCAVDYYLRSHNILPRMPGNLLSIQRNCIIRNCVRNK